VGGKLYRSFRNQLAHLAGRAAVRYQENCQHRSIQKTCGEQDESMGFGKARWHEIASTYARQLNLACGGDIVEGGRLRGKVVGDLGAIFLVATGT